MYLGVFSRWQRAIAITITMHFRIFHRLYSSSAIMADECDNIVVSQRVLGKYQPQAPLGITVKATLPNILESFKHPKANISQHYPNNVGWCCANMLRSFVRALRHANGRNKSQHCWAQQCWELLALVDTCCVVHANERNNYQHWRKVVILALITALFVPSFSSICL